MSAGIWRFENLKSRDFPEVLPLETTLRVFRTYKGEIERGILGTLRFVNTNPEVLDAAKTRNPELLQKYTDSAVESEPITFYAQEFTPESRDISRKIRAKMVDGTTREVDLFEALVTDGAVDVKVQCEERGQYYGMAQPDLYIRASDKLFWVNFVKSHITLWLQMVVVTKLRCHVQHVPHRFRRHAGDLGGHGDWLLLQPDHRRGLGRTGGRGGRSRRWCGW